MFIPAGRIPTRDEWQNAINTLELDLKLYPELVVATAFGFCPMVINGVAAGVEVYTNLPTTAEILDPPAAFKPLQGKVTIEHVCIRLRTAPTMEALACALGAAAGLVSGFGALVFDETVNECHSDATRLLAEMRDAIAQFHVEVKLSPEMLAIIEQLKNGTYQPPSDEELKRAGITVTTFTNLPPTSP